MNTTFDKLFTLVNLLFCLTIVSAVLYFSGALYSANLHPFLWPLECRQTVGIFVSVIWVCGFAMYGIMQDVKNDKN